MQSSKKVISHTRPTVLVTGASRGIGKAIATTFAKQGYDVIITCKNNYEDLMNVCSIIESMDVRCLAKRVDCASYEATERLFSDIHDFTDKLDCVINNAGIAHIGLLTDMTKAQWDNMLSTNLSSLFHTSKFAVPMMVRAQEGVIINISSIWGNVGASCEVAYSATKGGVNSFTKALAKELAPSHIRVNAIACGVINTAMNHQLTTEEHQALIESIGLNRIGSPKDIAETAYFLASKKAGYITGQILTIDGGFDY